MRYGRVASLMGMLWGELPFHDESSWSALVEHTLELDDQLGRDDGFVVLADGLSLQTLTRLIGSGPSSAAVCSQLPPALAIRVAAEFGRQAQEAWRAACQQVLEVATDRLAATAGGVYLRHGNEAVLSGYINWTPDEVNYWRRIPMQLDQPLPRSIVQARPVWQRYPSHDRTDSATTAMDLAAVPIGVDTARSGAAGAILLSWLHGPDAAVPVHVEPELEVLAKQLSESFEAWEPHARPR